MKKYLIVAAGFIASASLMFAAVPGIAANVDVNIVVPGVVIQQRPDYVRPQYESDWRERQVRAIEWRDNPNRHGKMVSRAAHARNDARKASRAKHRKNMRAD